MRHKVMGYSLCLSFLVTFGMFVSVAGALAGHFDHELLRMNAIEIRYQACFESAILASLAILYSRFVHLLPAVLTMIVFNPFHQFHFSFWTWQAIDWVALSFMAFCNIAYFSATQDIALRDYIAKRSQEDLHGSTGR